MRGRGTTGIEFMSADCLQVSKRVWEIESSALEKDSGGNQPLVDAILSALDHKGTEDDGLVVLCEVRDKLELEGSQKKELAGRLRTLGIECRNCGGIGKDHTPTFASSRRPTGKRRKRDPIRRTQQDSEGSSVL